MNDNRNAQNDFGRTLLKVSFVVVGMSIAIGVFGVYVCMKAAENDPIMTASGIILALSGIVGAFWGAHFIGSVKTAANEHE